MVSIDEQVRRENVHTHWATWPSVIKKCIKYISINKDASTRIEDLHGNKPGMRFPGTLRISLVWDKDFYEARVTDGAITHSGTVTVPWIVSSTTLNDLRIHGSYGQVDGCI